VTAVEAGIKLLPDPEVLAWAAEHGRILLTHDQRMEPDVYARVERGLPVPGVICVPQHLTRSKKGMQTVLEDLKVVALAGLPEDFSDRLQWLPL